jgi:hypothetical protein
MTMQTLLRLSLLAVLCSCLGGCPDEPEPKPGDAGVKVPEPGPLPEDGIVEEGEEKVVQAVGKARKGMDVSLSRQAASNRARAGIAKLLKEKGIEIDPPGMLNGVTIERIWTEGKFVYALGKLVIPADQPVNDSDPASSNPGMKDDPDPSMEE